MYISNITGLGDNVKPPLEQSFWDRTLFLWGVIANSYYEKSVMDIVYALNWNDGVWNWVSGKIDWKDVATIFNAYGNAVIANKISVFEYESLNKEQINNIINYVSKISGYDFNLVKRVLTQLYFYTKDGTIKFDGILRPGNLSKYAKNNVIPEELTIMSSSQIPNSNMFTFLGLPYWTGTALIITGIIGASAYFIMQAKSVGLLGKD